MYHLLLVAAGGAIGASLRHLAGMAAFRLLGPGFPWATVFVNVVGSFAMGLFIEILSRRFDGSNELRLFIATGLLGGFTTFSAFSLDFAVLYERGALGQAFGYAAGSVVVSIAALFVGLWVARSIA
ncbi:fluoride efflux transporter CrcB [Mesorhizobium sp. CAU 1741]|uniref:fluoride efflux transporter CrcB n=1 Tax=Mesorhizobium sp. CAU 1741 TaxID=3140366 RepID=UPI00325B65D5